MFPPVKIGGKIIRLSSQASKTHKPGFQGLRTKNPKVPFFIIVLVRCPANYHSLKYTLFFYKHAVYKHGRLKLAKELGTLLSTPQAEILGKKIFLLVSSTFAFQVWHFYKYFSNLLKNWYKFIINDHDIDAILFVHINIITY